MNIDCSSFKSVNNLVSDYQMKNYPLYVLVNNAGLYHSKKKLSIDKIPMIWQIYYLSGFYLTQQFIPLMIHSCTEQNTISNRIRQKAITEGRIINVSSMWHKYGNIDFKEIKDNKQFFGKRAKYGTSKLAQIMQCTHLQREIFTKYNMPLNAYSIHPGGVNTNMISLDNKILSDIFRWLCYPLLRIVLRTTVEGSWQTIYAAIAPNGNHIREWGGQLIPGAFHFNLIPIATEDRPNMQSVDSSEMKRLWDYSYNILNENRNVRSLNENNKLLIWTINAVWLYDIMSNEWQKWVDLKVNQQVFDGPCVLFGPQPSSTASTMKQGLYRIAGRSVSTDRCFKYAEYIPFSLSLIPEIKISSKNIYNEWLPLNGNTIERRCSAQSVFLRDKLLLIGGDDNGDELKTMEEYDFIHYKWKSKSSMNETRNDFGIACKHKSMQLYVFGGHSVNEQNNISSFLDSIEMYDYERNEWQLLDAHMLNGKRARCSAIFHENNEQQIYIAGGTYPCRNIVEMFDIHKIKAYSMPCLNHCHWWPALGFSNGRIVCCGINELSILNVFETLDIRENKQKWVTHKIESIVTDQNTKVQKIIFF